MRVPSFLKKSASSTPATWVLVLYALGPEDLLESAAPAVGAAAESATPVVRPKMSMLPPLRFIDSAASASRKPRSSTYCSRSAQLPKFELELSLNPCRLGKTAVAASRHHTKRNTGNRVECRFMTISPTESL